MQTCSRCPCTLYTSTTTDLCFNCVGTPDITPEHVSCLNCHRRICVAHAAAQMIQRQMCHTCILGENTHVNLSITDTVSRHHEVYIPNYLRGQPPRPRRIFIRSMSSTRSDDNKQCTICLSEFGDTDAAITRLGCKHVFHIPCLVPWLQRKSTCPTCRQDVPTHGTVTERSPVH